MDKTFREPKSKNQAAQASLFLINYRKGPPPPRSTPVWVVWVRDAWGALRGGVSLKGPLTQYEGPKPGEQGAKEQEVVLVVGGAAGEPLSRREEE